MTCPCSSGESSDSYRWTTLIHDVVRVSATDWLEKSLPDEPSWTVDQTVKLSSILAAHGVDLLDVSSAGLHPAQRLVRPDGSIEDIPVLSYQAPFSAAVKKANEEASTGLIVGAVGEITSGPIAEEILKKGMSDVVFIGRQMLKDPSSVATFAEQLGVKIKVAHQIGWGFGFSSSGRGHRS